MFRKGLVSVGFFLLLLTGYLTGCGGGSTPPGGGTQPASVSVTTSATTEDGTDSVTLSATVANDTNSAGVTWSVSGGGTLSNTTNSSATYTAPAATNSAVNVTVTATSVADSSKTKAVTITVAATPTIVAFQIFSGTVGTLFSEQLQGSGGVPPYKWTMTGGTLPPCVTMSTSGALTLTSGTAPTHSCLGVFYPTVTMTDSGTPTAFTTSSTFFTVMINPASAIQFTGSIFPNATENVPYTGGSVAAIGGAGSLTYTVASGALPNGINLNSTTAALTGTPTAKGTFNFTIMAADAYGDSNTQSYQIVVNDPALTGNRNLKGTYTCLTQGYDRYNSPWAMLSSIIADGQGNFTGGAYDVTGVDYTKVLSGTITGNYNIGTDNNGVATYAGTTWAIALSNATTPAQQIRMVEVDDVGSAPSTNVSTANCYLADTSAFTPSILNNGFVFGMSGQLDSGYVQATVGAKGGRFDSSGGTIANGYLDTLTAGESSATAATMTGSFGTLDTATGRVEATMSGTSASLTLLFYFIDGARAFVVDITPYNGTGELFAGDARVQQQKSYSAANVNGPFVLYAQGADIVTANGSRTPSGYYSEVVQGTADGKGHLAFGESYLDDNGQYLPSQLIGNWGLSFDTSNTGRVTFSTGNSTGYLYLYDNNSAFEMRISSNLVETGWLEPQSQTSFTDAAVAGDYMVGQWPLMQVGQNGSVGEFDLDSSGGSTGDVSTAGQGNYTQDQPLSMTYAWDSTVPGTGTLLTSKSLGTGSAICVVISPTKIACTPKSDTAPYLMIMQK